MCCRLPTLTHLKLTSEHEPLVAVRGGLGGEISRMNTGYFSKLFTMLSLDTQPRRRFPFFLFLKVNQSE